MATREIVLCEAVRTPIGTYDGSLKTVSAPDLGNVIHAGNKMNPARQSAVTSLDFHGKEFG